MKMTELEEKRIFAEIDETQANLRKLLAEQAKFDSETILNKKKTKWYEVALAAAIAGIVAAFVVKIIS